MKKLTIISALVIALLVSACGERLKKEAYVTRGNPNNLIDASAERVSFGLGNASVIGDVSGWINRDQPTRAELTCTDNSYTCNEVKSVLNQFGVPFKMVSKIGANNVVLVYERVVARDCDSRYVDNHFNPYNLNHKTFGCSVAANIVQHASEQSQITNPALQDPQDAERAVKVFNKYLEGKKCDGKWKKGDGKGPPLPCMMGPQ